LAIATNGHAALRPSATQARSEPELRAIIVQALRTSGIAVEEQVICAAGVADIVTARRDAVIEVKLDLTRKQIQWAVGQVLLYRAAINPSARAIVVGYATGETAGLVDWAAAVGRSPQARLERLREKLEFAQPYMRELPPSVRAELDANPAVQAALADMSRRPHEPPAAGAATAWVMGEDSDPNVQNLLHTLNMMAHD
jgi:hypothetical protein